MAFQPVPDVARFALVHQSGVGDELVNVLYFRRQGNWGLQDLEAAAQVLAQAWVNEIMTNLSSETRFYRIQSRGERVQDDVSFEFVLPTPAAGTRPGEAVPFQCAFCVTHLTGLVGRSNRGRTYFGYLSEADNNNGLLAVARANGLRNGLAAVRTIMANAGWTHVVVSRVRNKTRLNVAVTVPVIGYKYTDLIIDTQRRRRLNLGS
jgi:hypothetical protein